QLGSDFYTVIKEAGHTLWQKFGGEIDKKDSNGWTPLLINTENDKIIQLLLAAGVQVDQALNNDATALYIAAQNGHIDSARTLLAAGAKVNQATNDGITPLSKAVENGHTEILKLLLSAKASVNQATNDGITPLSKAVYQGNTYNIKLLLAANAKV